MNLTAAAAQSLPTARERAMATDLLDAEPVTRLTEDENPWFAGGEVAADLAAPWMGDLDDDESLAAWALGMES